MACPVADQPCFDNFQTCYTAKSVMTQADSVNGICVRAKLDSAVPGQN